MKIATGFHLPLYTLSPPTKHPPSSYPTQHHKTIEEEYCVENIDDVLKKVSKEIEDTRNSIIEEYKQGKLSSESYSAYFYEIWNTIMDSIEE